MVWVVHYSQFLVSNTFHDSSWAETRDFLGIEVHHNKTQVSRSPRAPAECLFFSGPLLRLWNMMSSVSSSHHLKYNQVEESWAFTYIYIYVYINIYICVIICIYVYMYVFIFIYWYACIYEYLYSFVYTIYMYIYIYLNMYIICIYIYKLYVWVNANFLNGGIINGMINGGHLIKYTVNRSWGWWLLPARVATPLQVHLNGASWCFEVYFRVSMISPK